MNDIGPYSNYRLTVRLELANKPGMFAKVASTLAEEGANLGAVVGTVIASRTPGEPVTFAEGSVVDLKLDGPVLVRPRR